MVSLRADVYVAPPIPWKKPDGTDGGEWSPCSCTLIHGDKQAILVDTPITTSQTADLITWIERRIPTKELTKIYITHWHGDHWFGLPSLLKRFPDAHPVATTATVARMKQLIEPKAFKPWGERFPGQIDQPFVLPSALSPGNEFFLEGKALQAINFAQAISCDSTVLWVPDIKLAICGDIVYGDVHQYLLEVDTKEKRAAWVESVRKMEALGPELVVPGHKLATEVDGAFHLESTRRYIEAFDGLLEAGAKDAKELSQKMLAKFPTRFNPHVLILGCINAMKMPRNTL